MENDEIYEFREIKNIIEDFREEEILSLDK